MINVVIVEDSVIEGEIYETILQSDEIHVTTVNNPLHAMDVIEYFKPNLILLDVNMPEMDGITLGKLIREYASTPIILLTAANDADTRLASVSIGALEFFNKPILAETLKECVHSHALVNWATESLKPAIDELSKIRNKYGDKSE